MVPRVEGWGGVLCQAETLGSAAEAVEPKTFADTTTSLSFSSTLLGPNKA